MTPRRRWLPVLMYHRVVDQMPGPDPYGNCLPLAEFESQMRWLVRRGYQTLSLAQVAATLDPGSPGPPAKSVAITFDDGYEDTYRLAWPVLRSLGLRAAVFVVVGAIGRDNAFDGEFGVAPARMASAEQLREMQGAGVDIGAHSMTHPADLSALDHSQLAVELGTARERLQAIIGRPVHCFAYPRSRRSERLEAEVGRHYRVAFSGEGRDFRPTSVSRVIAPVGGAGALARHLLRRRASHAAGPLLELWREGGSELSSASP